MKSFMKVLQMTEDMVDFFEDPDVERVFEIAATAVHPKFTGNKLAFRMGKVSVTYIYLP